MYFSTKPFSDLKTNRSILKSIFCDIGSQCKDFRAGAMSSFLSFSEDAGSSILVQLQLSDWLFRPTCEDTVAIINLTKDKHMDELFTILLILEMFFRWQKADFVIFFICLWKLMSDSITTPRFRTWPVVSRCNYWRFVLTLDWSSIGPKIITLVLFFI